MKAKFLMGALALALLAVSCGKDEPKNNGGTTTGGGTTTTVSEIKELALEFDGKRYGTGSEFALGELMIKKGHDEGVYEVDATLDVKAIDKGFIGDGYSLVVQKSSHEDNASVGLGDVCFNTCFSIDGPVASVTLPVSKDDPSLNIYDPNDSNHETDNQILIHYLIKQDQLDKVAGQTFKLKVTLSRHGKEVYSAYVSFVAKK